MTPEPAEEVLPDDLDIEPDAPDARAPLEAPSASLTATIGLVHAELPAAAHLGLSLSVRATGALRVAFVAESYNARTYLPRTDQTIPVVLPSLGAAVLLSAQSASAVRPWAGAGVSGVLMMSRPVLIAPLLAGRAGLDIGRGTFAWTIAGCAGVLAAPALPSLAGPTYRAVAPALAVFSGPSVRL